VDAIRCVHSGELNAQTAHTEAAEPTGWCANHIERPSGLSLGSTPNITKTPRPLQRAVDFVLTALLGPPPIYRRSNRMRAARCASICSPERLAIALSIPPPFSWLGGAVSPGVTLHGHLDPGHPAARVPACATPRQVTLELAILSEQKTAKVIQLLEESRRDNPLIRDRVDQEAEAMAQPADHIGARRDQGDSRRGGADQRLRRRPLGVATRNHRRSGPISSRDFGPHSVRL